MYHKVRSMRAPDATELTNNRYTCISVFFPFISAIPKLFLSKGVIKREKKLGENISLNFLVHLPIKPFNLLLSFLQYNDFNPNFCSNQRSNQEHSVIWFFFFLSFIFSFIYLFLLFFFPSFIQSLFLSFFKCFVIYTDINVVILYE